MSTAAAAVAVHDAEDDDPSGLRAVVEHVAHHLPSQAPIGAFVHHNTLHAFEHLPFHEAVAQAARRFGAEPYMTQARFRAELAVGRIRVEDIEAALSELYPDSADLPAGLDQSRLRRATLLGGIDELDEAAIDWELFEGDLLERIPPQDAERPRCQSALERSAHHLQATLKRVGSAALRAQLERATSMDEVADRFGVAADAFARQLERDSVPLVLRRVFAECRRLALFEEHRRDPFHRHRDALLSLDGPDVDDLIHPVLIRWSGAYLDTGLAYWPMPERERGFYRCVRNLSRHASDLPQAWMAGLRKELLRQKREGMTSLEAVADQLDALGVEAAEWETFIEAELLALPGWAGMFRRLETGPELRMRSLPYSLMDFLAIRLTAMNAALGAGIRTAGLDIGVRELRATARARPCRKSELRSAYRLFRLFVSAGVDLATIERLSPTEARRLESALDQFGDFDRRAVYQEAYERRYRHQVLDALAYNVEQQQKLEPVTPKLQVIMCIDDREESLRRHLEELDPEVETLGVAGYYGLAISYRGLTEAHAQPLCPAAQTPSHRIEEVPIDEVQAASWRRRWSLLSKTGFAGHVGARSLIRGMGLSLAGVVEAFPMVVRLLAPRAAHRTKEIIRERVVAAPETTLTALRDPDDESDLGYTLDEVVPKLAHTLEDMGLARAFAPLVVVLGHGSTSMNNPHEAAHECGACSGGKGGPNARLFSLLLNRSDVRARLLDEHGIDIPAATYFVGGIHDTSNDAVDLFDLSQVPDTHRERLAEARALLDEARARDAHERVRRFHSVPLSASPAEALKHVEGRAENLAEPRPEYGHCTNAICLVGRRHPQRGLFLDRRVFLVSYDPTQDEDGAILERLLASVGPVGAGINLEYYFSYVDQDKYGAGTKLPHNVTGLVGVMNGHESDLRTGLPYQMVDVHEPMRLLTVVEATEERLLAIAESQPGVGRLVGNGWIQLVAQHPETGSLSVLRPGGFVPYTPESEVQEFATSINCYRGQRDNVAPARILAGLSTESIDA